MYEKNRVKTCTVRPGGQNNKIIYSVQSFVLVIMNERYRDKIIIFAYIYIIYFHFDY